MPKPGPDDLSERLLAADAPVSDEAFREYRMQLEQKLDKALRMERYARITMIGLWVAVFVNMAIVSLLMSVWKIHSEAIGAFHAVLVIAAWVETIFYFARYRVKLTRVRDERQMALLQELSQRVSELSRRLDERGGAEVR
jgi:hypothetical protein